MIMSERDREILEAEREARHQALDEAIAKVEQMYEAWAEAERGSADLVVGMRSGLRAAHGILTGLMDTPPPRSEP